MPVPAAVALCQRSSGAKTISPTSAVMGGTRPIRKSSLPSRTIQNSAELSWKWPKSVAGGVGVPCDRMILAQVWSLLTTPPPDRFSLAWHTARRVLRRSTEALADLLNLKGDCAPRHPEIEAAKCAPCYLNEVMTGSSVPMGKVGVARFLAPLLTVG
jgi:hypothetical protein